MVANMIQISSDENDIILDPFAGSGTVLSQSAYMKRNYLGFELNKDYISMFKKYLKVTFSTKRKEYELFNDNNDQNIFEKRILDLRSLKFARVLVNKVEKESTLEDFQVFVALRGRSTSNNKLIEVQYEIIGEIDKKTFLEVANKLISKPPLSKFGIEANFKFKSSKKFNKKLHYGYTKTNSYSYNRKHDLYSKHIRVISSICVDLNENDYQ
jgi:hypothetical protein